MMFQFEIPSEVLQLAGKAVAAKNRVCKSPPSVRFSYFSGAKPRYDFCLVCTLEDSSRNCGMIATSCTNCLKETMPIFNPMAPEGV